MKELEQIRILDNEIFEELKKYFPKTTSSNFKKKFPSTTTLITMIDTSSTFIKNSIFNCCESDDYYGAKILFRSLIEHFFRFKYIFINWGKTRSDLFANTYLEYGRAREVLDLLKAMVTEQKLFDPNFKISDWDSLVKDIPIFKSKSIKQVDEETKKYSFKNIVIFLNKEFKKGDHEMSAFLGKLVLEYSNLSSFVHGGMKSYEEMISMTKNDKRILEYERISGLAFQVSNSIKMFMLLMFVQTDRQTFTSHYFNVEKILKQINN